MVALHFSALNLNYKKLQTPVTLSYVLYQNGFYCLELKIAFPLLAVIC